VLEDKKSDFYDQSLYKRGWSLYRASDYEDAIPLFFSLCRKNLGLNHKKSKQEEDALQSGLDIISLSFIQMDGARSLNAYFDKSRRKIL
jgi:predicted GNAT superfamily acetyltransferase